MKKWGNIYKLCPFRVICNTLVHILGTSSLLQANNIGNFYLPLIFSASLSFFLLDMDQPVLCHCAQVHHLSIAMDSSVHASLLRGNCPPNETNITM